MTHLLDDGLVSCTTTMRPELGLSAYGRRAEARARPEPGGVGAWPEVDLLLVHNRM
jgi:hypothetical protein